MEALTKFGKFDNDLFMFYCEGKNFIEQNIRKGGCIPIIYTYKCLQIITNTYLFIIVIWFVHEPRNFANDLNTCMKLADN